MRNESVRQEFDRLVGVASIAAEDCWKARHTIEKTRTDATPAMLAILQKAYAHWVAMHEKLHLFVESCRP